MKTAKLGAIFLVSVMALAGAGAGYAMWFQDLIIDAEIHTGEFMVGVRDDGTGDPGPHYLMGGELFPDPANPEEEGTADPNHLPGNNSEGKNVAATISVNGDYKFTKVIGEKKVDFYHNIYEYVYNAYPWYASMIHITFANGGTIPAKIAEGKWIYYNDTMGIMDFLVIDEVWISVDGKDYGPYDAQILEGFQYQLDPCHTVNFKIYFHFIEELADGSIMPQNANAEFTYFIKWAQWNEVEGDPWTP
jgi:hypothetical protein